MDCPNLLDHYNLGTGELDTASDHPSASKQAIKKAVREKYEQLD
jgi:hypothetical protein